MGSHSKNLNVPMKELVKHNGQEEVLEKLGKEQGRFSFPEAVAAEYIGSSKGKYKEKKEQNLKKCQEEIIKEIRNFQERQEGSLDESKRWSIAVDYLRNRNPRLPKLLRAFEDCFIGNFLDDLRKKANALKDALEAKMDNGQMSEKAALAFEKEVDSIIGKVNDGVDKNKKDEKKYPNKDLLDALAEAMAELGKKEKKLSLIGKREKRGKESKKQYRRKPERADEENLKEEFQFGKIWKADENKKKDGSYFDFIVQGFDNKVKKLLNVILIKKGGKRSYTLISPKALRRIKESGKYKVFEYDKGEGKRKNGKSKKDRLFRESNPADETLSLEKDPSNPGQYFDFVDEKKEAEYKNEIKKAGNFEEFYEVIKKIGRMKNNSGNIISAEQVVNKIEITRKLLGEKSKNFNLEDKKWTELWKKHLDLIPEIYGIRNKTGKLIREEIYGGGGGKREAEGQEKEQKFTEKEREIIGVLVEYAKKFQEKLEAEADWTGYSDKQKNNTLKIQTAVSVKLKMKEKNLFAGKADEVSEMVLEKIK